MADVVDEVINEEIVRLNNKISQINQQIESTLNNINNITDKQEKDNLNKHLMYFL